MEEFGYSKCSFLSESCCTFRIESYSNHFVEIESSTNRIIIRIILDESNHIRIISNRIIRNESDHFIHCYVKHSFRLCIPDHWCGTAWRSRTCRGTARFSMVRRGVARRGAARRCAARRFECGAARRGAAARRGGAGCNEYCVLNIACAWTQQRFA